MTSEIELRNAYKKGRRQGRIIERRLLKKKVNEAMFGWPGSLKSEVMSKIFERY